MAKEGRIAVVGFASGRIPTVAANRLLLRNISVIGAVWGGYIESRPTYVSEAQEKLLELYRGGKIRPQVGHRYAFEEAPRALRDVDQRKILGKAVLEV
jgi:NADPH2:quinone reductase